jgi:hypothetical protein
MNKYIWLELYIKTTHFITTKRIYLLVWSILDMVPSLFCNETTEYYSMQGRGRRDLKYASLIYTRQDLGYLEYELFCDHYYRTKDPFQTKTGNSQMKLTQERFPITSWKVSSVVFT